MMLLSLTCSELSSVCSIINYIAIYYGIKNQYRTILKEIVLCSQQRWRKNEQKAHNTVSIIQARLLFFLGCGGVRPS